MEMIVFEIDPMQIRVMADVIWFAGYSFLTVWVWKPAWIKKLKFNDPND
ncbi:hypothetical protein LCGC14_0458870 [marine sediment metagenome]|uniref:Uncharacterized protein n=1 Tax=marine sediment metagenome TaxID=412755 RepID=A0A0F9SL15_9ZZZZ